MTAASVHAEAILAAYDQIPANHWVSDAYLQTRTGLTEGQYNAGKVYLRETVSAERGMAYIASHDGWMLTTDEDDIQAYHRLRARVALTNLRRTRRSTAALASINPRAARYMDRDLRRVEEELLEILNTP